MVLRWIMFACIYTVAIGGLLTVSTHIAERPGLEKTSRLSGPAFDDLFLLERFG